MRNGTRHERPTVIDLFAGAGGATEGLRRAGYRVLAAIELDRNAARTFHANHPTVELRVEDIRSVSALALRHDLGLDRGNLSLLKACPPCQGYSTLGPSKHSDPRNDLVDEVWSFITEFRPKAVMLENVPGLKNDRRLTMLVRRLRASGYRVRDYLVDAQAFGVPQRRTRLIVVAARHARPPEKLEKLLPPDFVHRRRLTVRGLFRIAERIDPAQDSVHRGRKPSLDVERRLVALPVGGTRFDLPESLQLACHRRLAAKHATAVYGRIRLDEPAPTMTTRCTTPSCGRFVHPTQARGLTLREAALLQTFPRGYRFIGSYGEIERQIGNALPVRMAEGLGLGLLPLLEAE